jgi:hypothetical protein
MLEDYKDERSSRIKKEIKGKWTQKKGVNRKNERDNKFVRVEGNFVCKWVKKEMVKICGKSMLHLILPL